MRTLTAFFVVSVLGWWLLAPAPSWYYEAGVIVGLVFLFYAILGDVGDKPDEIGRLRTENERLRSALQDELRC